MQGKRINGVMDEWIIGGRPNARGAPSINPTIHQSIHPA
jgi:hypothetical protein